MVVLGSQGPIFGGSHRKFHIFQRFQIFAPQRYSNMAPWKKTAPFATWLFHDNHHNHYIEVRDFLHWFFHDLDLWDFAAFFPMIFSMFFSVRGSCWPWHVCDTCDTVEDIAYYLRVFRDELKRDPTTVECFDLAQEPVTLMLRNGNWTELRPTHTYAYVWLYKIVYIYIYTCIHIYIYTYIYIIVYI